MRWMFVFTAFLFLFVSGGANMSWAAVDVGVSIDRDGIKEFHLAIGEHYRVPEKEIIVVKQKNIPDEELPVLYFLARKSGGDVSALLKLRLEGKSWMDITLHLGLTPEIYYVPLSKPAGPPYGKAYGHYRKRNREEWGKIRLSDGEIINFVNLSFMSQHYGYSPDEIVSMRGKGKNFVEINTEIKKNKGGNKKKDEMKMSEKPGKNKGKSKNPK